MIIITITYPARLGYYDQYSKDYTFKRVGPHIEDYIKKKMASGRITHVVVRNDDDNVIWDSDRDEDWF